MGFKNNWNLIYNNLDFLIFPNKDLAIGRPVFEAAFYKVPSIVCINKKNNAYVKDNISGFTYYPNTELEIKKSIIKALNHTNIDHIKKNSFIMAKTNFSIHKNANAVVNIYKKILCSKSQ